MMLELAEKMLINGINEDEVDEILQGFFN